MKQIKPVKLFGLLFIIFGITYLNFDNLSFSENNKPYASLIIGLIIIAITVLVPLKNKK